MQIKKRLRATMRLARDEGWKPVRFRVSPAMARAYLDQIHERGATVETDPELVEKFRREDHRFTGVAVEADESVAGEDIAVDAMGEDGELRGVMVCRAFADEPEAPKFEGLGATSRIIAALAAAREKGREPAAVKIATDLDRRFEDEIPATPPFDRPSAYFSGTIRSTPLLARGSVRVEDKDGEEIVTLGADDFACLEAWFRVTEEGKAATRETLHAMGFHAGAAYAARETGRIVEQAVQAMGGPGGPRMNFAPLAIPPDMARAILAKRQPPPPVSGKGRRRVALTVDLDEEVALAIKAGAHVGVSIGDVAREVEVAETLIEPSSATAEDVRDAINASAPTEPPPDSAPPPPEQIRGDVVRMVSEACDRVLELPEEPDPKGRHCRELEVAREILFALAIDIGDNGIDRPYAVIGDALSELVAQDRESYGEEANDGA